MGTVSTTVVHKHFRLDAAKLKRAQKLLDAPTETETIERALDRAIAEEERDRRVLSAHEEFFLSGIEIRDAFGALGEGTLGK
jgi:ssDNA-specific exonuclease RecJ